MSAGSPPPWLTEVTDLVPDFPQAGIEFRDLSPLWRSSAAMSRCSVALADGLSDIDLVVGIEARGFLAGLLTAQRLGVGFVAARKPGKLPGDLHRIDYDLEYGSDALEIQRSAINRGERVVIVDDVIATGGTARAAIDLVEESGGEVVGVRAVLELRGLNGRRLLDPHSVHALWEIKD